ncbi:MAG TPA: hypothetical protein VFT31_08610 [Kribbella sp.]|nr:hypothetical protein [Kribbella sp.]
MAVRRSGAIAAMVVVVAVAMTACAPGPNELAGTGGSQDAGFWLGLWQGLICVITLIVSLFNDNVNVYEVHNNGAWYNCGFVLGILIMASGTGASGYRARS